MDPLHDIRKKFFDFFEKRGHRVVPSSSLVPDDSSVLLTTAGMQQFKRYYTGELDPMHDFGTARATSVQKCFRTTDFEEVGDDTHLTFFEMLGNFSFGPVGADDPNDASSAGYFKRAAITWGYEFITSVLGISPERIYVTVFEGDTHTPRDEASYAIWRNDIGLGPERIFLGSRADNFWGPTGAEGPCGPTTEIYVAQSAQAALAQKGVEVWNIVFNEYIARAQQDGSHVFHAVHNPGIDTGMGLERLLTIVEGKETIFETSALLPIINALRAHAPAVPQRDIRILADHIRGAVFLISDGITPSNKEAGYILRRLLRKIIALKITYDIHTDIFLEGQRVIETLFGDIYPLIKETERISAVWHEEEQRFQESIAKGLKELAKLKDISGADAFRIYESYGLPYELIQELAPSHATARMTREDFEEAYKKHQSISRAGAEKKFGGHGLVLDTGELKAGDSGEMERVIRMHTATHLLQWTLRTLLGENIHQMGSDINPDRMRFDFNFDRKLTPEELRAVELMVNERIKEDLPVYYKEMSKDEAMTLGALSFFREKYPETVKVYFIGSQESGGVVSMEFCGGPHVEQTGQIGTFSITKEESVGKGIRRIRARVL